jgi:hypothetical protein
MAATPAGTTPAGAVATTGAELAADSKLLACGACQAAIDTTAAAIPATAVVLIYLLFMLKITSVH